MIWLLPLLCFLATAFATGGLRNLLRRRAILDHPNARSSHREPTPRGAGLALVPVLLLGWVWLGNGAAIWPVFLAAACLAALSWTDDLYHLPVLARLAGQAAAVAAGLATLPGDGAIFGGVGMPWLERLLVGLVWLWFVNLFNFMDGIDGISGVESICIGVGLSLVLLAAGEAGGLVPYGLTLAAAAAGFLVWNWPPAKIFLGDVGSVTLGYLAGWLLLGLAAKGFWAAALLLPLYYLADATITLLRRLMRGEKVWQAHRQHFYQQGADRLGSHASVSVWLLVLNFGLIGLAICSAVAPALAAATAISGLAPVALLLWYFAGIKGKAQHVD